MTCCPAPQQWKALDSIGVGYFSLDLPSAELERADCVELPESDVALIRRVLVVIRDWELRCTWIFAPDMTSTWLKPATLCIASTSFELLYSRGKEGTHDRSASH